MQNYDDGYLNMLADQKGINFVAAELAALLLFERHAFREQKQKLESKTRAWEQCEADNAKFLKLWNDGRLKIEALEAEVGRKAIEIRDLKMCSDEAMKTSLDIEKQRDDAILQIEEMSQRIYKIGLICDRVAGLESGFCPDVGEPRDNITRIKIALERFTEKRLTVRWCPKCGNVNCINEVCSICGGKTQAPPAAGPIEGA